jgi:hypothetical protein
VAQNSSGTAQVVDGLHASLGRLLRKEAGRRVVPARRGMAGAAEILAGRI